MVPAFYTTGDYSKDHETKKELTKRESNESAAARTNDEEPATMSEIDSLEVQDARGISMDRLPGTKVPMKKKAPTKL